MEEAWHRLVEKIIPAKARHFNGERLAAKEYTVAQVIEKLSTLPMFGTKQLVMAQHIEVWLKEQRTTLLSYLAHPYPYSCLVLTASQKKGLEKIESAAAAVGITIHYAAPTEKEAPRWIQERAKIHGKTISPKAAFILVEQLGANLFRLERELEKLAAYVGNHEKIDVEDVQQTVSAQRSHSVFELLRYVSRRQSNRAVASLRNLVLAGESPLGILALLARQIRILWQVKDGLESGLPLGEIGRLLNLRQFVAQNYAQQASSFSEADLYRIHQAIRDTDLALKSTGSSPEAMMEELVLRLCRTRQKSPRGISPKGFLIPNS